MKIMRILQINWRRRHEQMRRRTCGKKFENRSSERTGRDLQRKRVKPSKEECGRCRKENIGNSISGGATSRTPEYISSSHGKREGGRWREHGGGEAVERLWGLLRDSFVTFPPRFQQLLLYFSLSSGSSPTISSQFRRSDGEPNLPNLLCHAFRQLSLFYFFFC